MLQQNRDGYNGLNNGAHCKAPRVDRTRRCTANSVQIKVLHIIAIEPTPANQCLGHQQQQQQQYGLRIECVTLDRMAATLDRQLFPFQTIEIDYHLAYRCSCSCSCRVVVIDPRVRASRAAVSIAQHQRTFVSVCIQRFVIGIDLAEILGGRMASAEGGLVPSG